MKRFSPYLLSALLFALALPIFPSLHLEFLEWVWMVPLLLALRDVHTLGGLLWRSYLTMFIGWALVMSWLLWATAAGGALLFFVGAFVYTVPMVAFHFLRRSLGWRAALWSLPVIWTACEWLYHQTPGAIGWLSLGLPQSRLWWLIQFVDLTGVWGVTFWIVLFNVLIVDCAQRWWLRIADCGRGEFPNDVVLCEDNVSWKSAIRNPQSAIFRRLALIVALMFGLPLGYTAFRWIEHSRAEKNELSILLTQPNVNPWLKTSLETRAAELRRSLTLTNRALRAQPNSFDLIVWPETAIPFVLPQDEQTRMLVGDHVSRWQTPLLSGALNLRSYPDPAERSELLKFQNRDYELFNAAFLFTPRNDVQSSAFRRKKSNSGNHSVEGGAPKSKLQEAATLSAPYHKQKLMPFVEQVPLVEQFPALASLALDFGAGNSIDLGVESNLFTFTTRTGRPVTVAAAICYEQFFPAHLAGLVRQGGEMIALMTNIGWFSQSHGQHQIAAFLQMRAIELRRSVVCAANTGQTTMIDPLGRVTAETPWWAEQTLSGQAQLSSTLSFYVRHPDLFPKVCALLTALILTLAVYWRALLGWLKLSPVDGRALTN
ncbi:MAG: nitrilase-related carbon-nitrogen hydrolase [Acidobacteriota bacterium]|nr:nitrilase-related carbon-nitrogen hydrolase [Acidobacteriota bacterium]